MSPASPQDLIRPEILGLSAYQVADASGMVKLDAMENPYALPAALQAELGATLGAAEINRYPDPGAAALKGLMRERLDIPAHADLMLGNGSDELIQILALALARPGAVMLSVEPTFVMYRMIAAYAGMRYVGVPLREDFSLDLDAVKQAMKQDRPALVFLAWPNNPTGNLFDRADVLKIVEAAPGLVVVDEAYHAFAQESLADELARHPNLLVMRTLSKLGLAGLRLGYLMGAPSWVCELDKVRLPYNINTLTQNAASLALRNIEVLNGQARMIREERTRVSMRLAAIATVQVFPSAANFLLFRVGDAARVFDGLKCRNVLIKKLDGAHPALAGCLRVTVGKTEENDRFLDALRQTLAEMPCHA
jgi:histidinol-phosphate aminotransferase